MLFRSHMLYFCTINHGNFPFFQKTVSPPLDLLFVKTGVFRIYYTDKSGSCQSVQAQFSTGFSERKIAISRGVGVKSIRQHVIPSHAAAWRGNPPVRAKICQNQVKILGDCHGFLRNPRNDSSNQLPDKQEFVIH